MLFEASPLDWYCKGGMPMKTVIYVDVLLGINFIIDYYLLLAAKHLSGASGGNIRLLLGSALAALSSLMLLAPPMHPVISVLIKLLICVCCVRAAFRYTGWRTLAKATCWFFLLNFLLAGVVFFAMYTFSASGIHQNNFAVYFNVSPWMLLFSVLSVYLVLEVFSLLFRPPHTETALEFGFRLGDTLIRAHALYDTGFSVKDALTGYPCVLISLPAMKKQLPKKLAATLEEYFKSGTLGEGLHLVPCTTAQGRGLLPANVCQDVLLYKGKKEQRLGAVTVLFTDKPLAEGTYEALAGPAVAGALV